VACGAASYAQEPLEISGKAEIMVDFMRADGGEEDAASDVDIDLKMKKVLSDKVTVKVKLDVEDTADDGDLVEEAYIVLKDVGPLVLSFGRKEVKAGQDKMLWETFPFMHKNEHDNKIALEACAPIGEKVKVYLTTFQETEGASTANEPYDQFQSWAVKGEVKLAENLQLNVSALNAHNESFTGPGQAQDEHQICVGLVYDNKETGLCIFAEYMMVENWFDDLGETPTEVYIDGDDGAIIHLGVKMSFGAEKKSSIGLIGEQQMSKFMGGGRTRDDKRLIAGFGYKAAPKCELFGELTMDRSNLTATEETLFTVGTIVKF
jgi:hypothetical protein